MAKRTNKVAPKMHYYIVEWDGQLCVRNCSEYLYDDEEIVALMHKDDFYDAEMCAKKEGVKLMQDKKTFLDFMHAHHMEKGWVF